MRRLENELDVPLFGTGEGFPLTAYGDLFLSLSCDVCDAVGRFEQEKKLLWNHEHNVRVIGCVEGFFEYADEDALNTLLPDVGVVARAKRTEEEAYKGLENGEYELAVLPYVQRPGLTERRLVDERMYLWIDADDPLAEKGEITLHDVDRRVLAIWAAGDSFVKELSVRIKSAKLDIALKPMHDVMSVFESVRRNEAVGLTSRNHAMKMSGLGVASVPMRDVRLRYSACWNCGSMLSEEGQRLVEALEYHCTEFREE